MLRDLGYERNEKFFYREHTRDLDTSVRLIYDDASVEIMFKVVRERSLILMYVKNSHPIREYFQNTANLYGIKESRSTAYS